MKLKITLLVFCTIGFSLLSVIALLERNVVSLLIETSAEVTEANIRLTFSALQSIVGVLPYTLGIIIAGTFILSILQIFKSDKKLFSVAVLLVLLIPMIYNIFVADTAAVVEGIETTKMSDQLSTVQSRLLGAVKQHYIGMVGFAMAFTLQLIYTLRSISG